MHQTEAKRASLLVRTEDGLVIQEARCIPRLVAERTAISVGSGIAGWVAQHQRPLFIEHEDQLPPGLKLRSRGYRTDSLISVPIKLGRTTVGVINVADPPDDRPFTTRELETLVLIARQAADLIRLHQTASEALRRADLDSLTGLANRRSLDQRLPGEVARAKRYGAPFSILMIDLDDFKAVNDRYGHHAGDVTLKIAAQRIQALIRTADMAFRYGGDEFIVGLPSTDPKQAVEPGRRLVEQLRSIRLPSPLRAWKAGLKASIGIATTPDHAETATNLIARADQALRLAKALGTGLEVWEPEMPSLGTYEGLPPWPDADPSGAPWQRNSIRQ